jgi:hypothetical protein
LKLLFGDAAQIAFLVALDVKGERPFFRNLGRFQSFTRVGGNISDPAR